MLKKTVAGILALCMMSIGMFTFAEDMETEALGAEITELSEQTEEENEETLLGGSYQYTTAEEAKRNKALFEMVTYGIILGDENGAYHLEEPVTRSEGAAVMNRLNRIDVSVIGSDETVKFSDVSRDDWFFADVYWVEATGIMNGYPDLTFRPDAFLDYAEFSKMLICTLGYKYVAEENGGYPSGYVALAQQLGITTGIQIGQEFTRGQMVQMLYQAFDVNMAVNNWTESGISVERVEGQTLRNTFDTNGELWIKQVGVVTANATTWLSAPVDGLKDNEVQIDNYVYDAGNTDIADCLGAEVEFYCFVDGDDNFRIQSYRLTKNNSVTEITDENIVQAENKTLTYYEDGVKRKISYDANAVFVKNGRLLLNGDESDLLLTNGYIQMRDNTGDENADVVFIYEYQSFVTDRISNNTIYWKSGQELDGKTFLHFDETDRYLSYEIQSKDGESMTIADIQSGDVVSVFQSRDGQVNKLIVSDQLAEGTVQQITDDEVTIDGAVYQFAGETDATVAPGDNITAYLNHMNKIVYMEEGTVQRKLYGYVAEVEANNAMLSDIYVRMLTPGDFKEKEIINDDDAFNITVTKKLVGQNAQVQTLKLASKVKIEDTSVTAAEAAAYLQNLENRITAYELNSNGEIKFLGKPVVVKNENLALPGDTQKYNANEKIFGGNGTGVFGVNETTKVLCIPDENGITDLEDYLARIEINHNSQYQVKGYDLDEETKIAKLIAITMRLRANEPGVINDSSELAVCTSCKQIIDSNGEVKTEVSFLSEKSAMKYVLADSYLSEFEGLQKGDVFYYALNSSDNISLVQKVAALLPANGFYSDGLASSNKTVLGRVANIDLNELSDVDLKWIERITLEIAEDGSVTDTVEISKNSTPAIYVIGSDKNPEIRVGTLDDIEVVEDKLFVQYKNGKIDGVVVMKQ